MEKNMTLDSVNSNPFCLSCKETDCLIDGEETCAMIRKYLHADNNRKSFEYCKSCDLRTTRPEEFSEHGIRFEVLAEMANEINGKFEDEPKIIRD